jgi:hypothetical protein
MERISEGKQGTMGDHRPLGKELELHRQAGTVQWQVVNLHY